MQKHLSALLGALAIIGAAGRAGAQVIDSTPRFSIFTGAVGGDGNGSRITSILNAEFGASGDFRLKGFPHTLRVSGAFRQDRNDWTLTPMKFGSLSLDVVGKPIPRIFAMQPYLLGGLGVATRAEFVGVQSVFSGSGGQSFRTISIPRHTWAFVEGGAGLELGRHLFIQAKLMIPVASQGPTFIPVSVGFRFWD